MIRKIIHIDQDKCDGCGLCAAAYHEEAIEMVGGKAKLLREDSCDGLGDYLPSCHAGAITFVEREAPAYDAAAVKAAQEKKQREAAFTGCPGSMARGISRNLSSPVEPSDGFSQSMLPQWPVQIKLAPVNAPWLNGAKLLIAADCTAYACGDFHSRFIRDKIVLIGCPKLDEIDYAKKLTRIIAENDIRSVTVVRMEVPCCGGIENAAKRALQGSGKFIPWQVIIVGIDGIVRDEW